MKNCCRKISRKTEEKIFKKFQNFLQKFLNFFKVLVPSLSKTSKEPLFQTSLKLRMTQPRCFHLYQQTCKYCSNFFC